MKNFFLTSSLLFAASLLFAVQAERVTIKQWNLDAYSETTIANLAADAAHWTMNSKGGRYQNVVATDGGELYANGQVIPETQGLYVGAGVPAGSLLLCYDRGSNGSAVYYDGESTRAVCPTPSRA